MGILVERVRIRNFRSLKNVEVSLTTMTLLVGSNNAGKTSFLRALNLALGVERRNVTLDDLFIDRNGGRLTGQDGQPDRVIAIDVKIIPVNAKLERVDTFDNDWSQEFGGDIELEGGDKECLAFRTQYSFDTQREEAQYKRFVLRGNWNAPTINENSDKLNALLDKIPLYFIDAQRDILDDLRNRTSYFGRLSTQIKYDPTVLEELEDQLKTLNEDAIEKSPVMSHLKGKLEELNSTMSAGGSGVEITPLPKKIRDLHKTMKVHFQDGESEVFELDYHGMGTRSWASLLAFKAYVSWEGDTRNPVPKQPFFPLLALEEPEAHLHPNAQKQLYGQLKGIEGQKIVSTHSPYIVSQAQLEEIRYFRKDTDETILIPFNFSGIQKDELVALRQEYVKSRGELFFSKVVVLSEGNTEERVLPVIAAKYFSCDHHDLGINFVGCGGNNYRVFLKLFNALQIPWVIFSDFDKHNIQRGVQNALAGIGVNDVTICNEAICLNSSLEEYLITTGYQNELKNAILKSKEPFASPEFEVAQRTSIGNLDDVQLLNELKQEKKLYAGFYAEEIGNLPEPRCYPQKIKQLFDTLALKLNRVARP